MRVGRKSAFTRGGRGDSEVNWDSGWMPQKASRYPPIHDQIDTPIDFSMAVRRGMAEERWREVTERSKGEMS